MARSVVDGVLKQVSPSSINAFDASTAFGCERRWFFRYVLDKVEPQTGNTQLGTNVHRMNEEYLKNGKWLGSTEEATQLFMAGRYYLDEIRPNVIAVEASVKSDLAGIPLVGFCDVVTKTGIIDWKTSSNVGRYGKKGFELSNDTQMLVYAQALLPHLDSWKLVHGQYQTRGKLSFQLAEGRINRADLDKRFDNVIIPLVDRMKSAAGEKDVEALQADRNKCGRCPHSMYCPKDENPIMSILSSFKKAAPVATLAPASVVPPDAPKSDPALAAKPVDGYVPRHRIVDEEPAPAVTAPEAPVVELAPAPEPTPPPAPAPRRGRPAGSKNAPKPITVPAGTTADLGQPGPVTAAPLSPCGINYAVLNGTAGGLVIKTITISHGATVNLGNFNSSRCDISMTAEVSGDVSAAYKALDTLVKTELLAEVEAYSKVATK